MTQKYLNELTHSIIGSAIEVHRELGPGLLESIYEKCLSHVLKEKGFHLLLQQKVPLVFRGLYLDCDLLKTSGETQRNSIELQLHQYF